MYANSKTAYSDNRWHLVTAGLTWDPPAFNHERKRALDACHHGACGDLGCRSLQCRVCFVGPEPGEPQCTHNYPETCPVCYPRTTHGPRVNLISDKGYVVRHTQTRYAPHLNHLVNPGRAVYVPVRYRA